MTKSNSKQTATRAENMKALTAALNASLDELQETGEDTHPHMATILPEGGREITTIEKQMLVVEGDNLTADIEDLVLTHLDDLKESDYAEKDRVDRCIHHINVILDSLAEVRDNLEEQAYDEVREAMKTDRQLAAESIILWRNQGEDAETVATNLHSTIENLNDIIDEFEE